MSDAPIPADLWKWLARRQLGVALFTLSIASGLLLAGKIDAARWSDVTVWVVGLYMLGDAGGAWAANWKRGP